MSQLERPLKLDKAHMETGRQANTAHERRREEEEEKEHTL